MRRTRVNQETPYGAVRMAVIDICLNSVKLLISTKQLNSKIDFDKDESTINLLSNTLKLDKPIEGEELNRLLEIISQYLSIALKYCEPRFTKIVSSEVLHNAKNKRAIINKINKIWYERVEVALKDRVKLWEKEVQKPKKTETKSSSLNPDKVRKDFDNFKLLIKNKCNMTLDEFLSSDETIKKFCFSEFKPDIKTYSKVKATELYYNLILNDIQKSHAKKFNPNSTIVDLTGDTLRITKYENGKVISDEELPIGFLSYTYKYIKSENIDRKLISSIIYPATKFFRNNPVEVSDNLIFIGGSAINLARICREVPVNRSNDVHGYELTIEKLQTLLEGMCALTYKKRNTLIGLQESRQNTIISACIIFMEFMKAIKKDKAYLSTYGLRHKILIDLLEQNFEIEKKKREFEEFKSKYPNITISEK